MPAKQLICECGANCGTMEKGRFIKGGMILCPKCAERYRLLIMLQNTKKYHKGNGFEDMFKDIFGEGNSPFK